MIRNPLFLGFLLLFSCFSEVRYPWLSFPFEVGWCLLDALGLFLERVWFVCFWTCIPYLGIFVAWAFICLMIMTFLDVCGWENKCEKAHFKMEKIWLVLLKMREFNVCENLPQFKTWKIMKFNNFSCICVGPYYLMCSLKLPSIKNDPFCGLPYHL